MRVDLTDREREILYWTSMGKTAWEIGAILSVSPRTVESVLQRCQTKLKAANKIHAVATAIKHGCIGALSAGLGMGAYNAIWAYKMARLYDWIGPPGGIV